MDNTPEVSVRFGINSTSKRYLSKDDALFLLEAMDASIMCRDEDELRDLLLNFGSIFGAERSFCLLASLDDKGRIESADALNVSFPSSWLRRYISKEHYHSDPVASENFRSFEVKHWAHADQASHQDAGNSLISGKGYSCGARCTNGKQKGSMFYFSGDAVEQHPRTELILRYSTTFLHEALTRIKHTPSAAMQNVLTVREQEILSCIHDGMTDPLTASRLKISAHTVKFHVKNILYKLDATSRYHAVAIALKKNLLK